MIKLPSKENTQQRQDNITHKYDIETNNCDKWRLQIQDIGNAFLK